MNENRSPTEDVSLISAIEPVLNWCVYMIRCSDNSLYTGITTDINRRFRQHAEGKGAKYFRGRSPLQVVFREENHSRCSAASREFWIKSMNRAEKELMAARELTRR
jgi:putative endonuclease